MVEIVKNLFLAPSPLSRCVITGRVLVQSVERLFSAYFNPGLKELIQKKPALIKSEHIHTFAAVFAIVSIHSNQVLRPPVATSDEWVFFFIVTWGPEKTNFCL